MIDYDKDVGFRLRIIKMFAAATEELCGEPVLPELASYWAVCGLTQTLKMIPTDDRTDAETSLLDALESYLADPSVDDMIEAKA